MTNINLACSRGDTSDWTLTATKESIPIDLTDGSVIMAVRRNWASPVLFELTSSPSGGITIESPATAGIATLKLRPDDTLQLSNQTNVLVYTVHVFTSTGDQWLVARGTLTVDPIAWDGTI